MRQAEWLAKAFRKTQNNFFVIRGPSGTGKSHLASKLAAMFAKCNQTTLVCTADDFFMQDGDYVFEPSKLGEAHFACQQKFLSGIATMKQHIILANTSSRGWEYLNYITMAELRGYKPMIAEIMPATVDDLKLCAGRNSHGVDAPIVAAQTFRFEPNPNADRLGIEF